tara:strand:+ start:2201 stop:2428 length:228 start_codon:yes stop_codon:yes gene_type:complete
MTQKEENKIYFYIFIGGVVAVIYITLFGNYPLLPGLYDFFGDAPFKYLLFPIPAFPIIFGLGGYLYLETKKDDNK